ncbi:MULTISPECIES: MFS transporter [unclassified Pseudonocardia]|uniref:MFS transporter n=1 Tax=unclassified Pseudonocardia TaxID=2619320 RepID=UPI000680C1B5|nr:MFS transporter [Pseudonocardia sp. Ae707_Ps1]OLM18318.1 putative transporter [Pseudonocardia sp. Ae707_Ps1]
MTGSDLGSLSVARPVTLFTRGGVVTALGAFVLIGGLQAAYGPALPTFQERFGLGPTGAGLALSAHFLGGVAGVLLFHRRFNGRSDRAMLVGCHLAVAGGAVVFALASVWWLVLAGALVAGLGFGGLDYGLNHMFAVGFGARSTFMLNLLNAFFGVGAIIAPAVVGALGADNYSVVFLAFALLALLLLLGLGGVRPRPARTEADDPVGADRARTSALLGMVLAFVVLYALNVGIESAVGGWETTHLIGVGWTAGAAATATAAYWLMMTLGRFVVLPLTVHVRPSTIVLVSLGGMGACFGLAMVPALAPWAYAGVGLFIAPIFPTGLAWLYELAPAVRRRAAHVIAASMAGSVVLPTLLGLGIEALSVEVVPGALFVLNAICLALAWKLVRLGRPAGPRRQASPEVGELP